jgi:hypothetical protein
MNIELTCGDQRLTELAFESETAAARTSGGADAHERPTVVPPALDDPPPTRRWTPSPALIASSR